MYGSGHSVGLLVNVEVMPSAGDGDVQVEEVD